MGWGATMGRRTWTAILLTVAALLLASCQPVSPWRHEPANVDASGAAGGSGGTVISPDGSKVAFVTTADDVGPVDTNGEPDVYLRDLDTGETTLVSVNDDGTDSRNGWSSQPAFSSDGTRVAFLSNGQGVEGSGPPSEWPSTMNVYVRDLTTDTTFRASAGGEIEKPGLAATGLSRWGRFIGNSGFRLLGAGAHVLYVHEFKDDSTVPATKHYYYYYQDVVSGEREELGGWDGRTGHDQLRPSSDGTKLTYINWRPANDQRARCTGDPVPDVDERVADVCVRDLLTGEVTVIDSSAGYAHGAVGDDPVFDAAFTDDGSTLAFMNSNGDLVMHDLTTDSTDVVEVDLPGHVRRWRLAAIDSSGIVLVGLDQHIGIYHHSLATGSTELLSTHTDGYAFDAPLNDLDSEPNAVALKGSTVFVITTEGDLGPTDTNGTFDIYAHDLTSGRTTLVSANADGTDSGNASSTNASVSDDGRRVAFSSWANDLGPTDINSGYDGYVATLRSADIGVAATVSPEPVPSGGTVTYSVDVTNDGPDAAAGLTAAVVLPGDGVTFGSVATTSGACEPPSPEEPRVVLCTFGDTTPGAVGTITVQANVTAESGSSLEAVVATRSTTTDLDESDNVAVITSTVA